jgi:hypothetical protein
VKGKSEGEEVGPHRPQAHAHLCERPHSLRFNTDHSVSLHGPPDQSDRGRRGENNTVPPRPRHDMVTALSNPDRSERCRIRLIEWAYLMQQQRDERWFRNIMMLYIRLGGNGMPEDIGPPILKLGLRHECITMSLYESFGVPSGRPVAPISTPNTHTRMLPRLSSRLSTATIGCTQIMKVWGQTDIKIRGVPKVSCFNARAPVRIKPLADAGSSQQ